MKKKLFSILLASAAVAVTVSCGGGDDGPGGTEGGGGGGTGDLVNLTPSRSLAFPGVDGGGKAVTGGAGGEVIHVTTLNDGGSGSLREAIAKAGKRTIVFDISGTIHLTSDLAIGKGDLTIAGQTAPGDGICIADYPVTVEADNVIIRFIRFRLGEVGGQAKKTMDPYYEGDDALGGKDIKNIVIDHCSVSWSTDECASFYGTENFTMQYCVISESLKQSVHVKGNHGYGGIWGGYNATYHHNLLAHHDSRNPRFDHYYVWKGMGQLDFVNNVVYNWGGNSSYGGESYALQYLRSINMVGNYYKAGNNSNHKNRIVNPTTQCSNCNSSSPASVVPGKFFIEKNYVNGYSDVTADNWKGVEPDDASKLSSVKASSYFGTRISQEENAEDAYNNVLAYAGASLVRDAVDTRVLNDVKNGTGSLINSPSDVGGYPALSTGKTITDTDRDGMPDEWEMAEMTKLNVKNKSLSAFKPGAYNISAKYTNLEIYLNELVKGTFPAKANASATR